MYTIERGKYITLNYPLLQKTRDIFVTMAYRLAMITFRTAYKRLNMQLDDINESCGLELRMDYRGKTQNVYIDIVDIIGKNISTFLGFKITPTWIRIVFPDKHPVGLKTKHATLKSLFDI